jgi:hypothetical protein
MIEAILDDEILGRAEMRVCHHKNIESPAATCRTIRCLNSSASSLEISPVRTLMEKTDWISTSVSCEMTILLSGSDKMRVTSTVPSSEPRRSPRVDHFCSFKVAHMKNSRWRGASNIIHAEGVRVGSSSCTLKACNAFELQYKTACVGNRRPGGSDRAMRHSSEQHEVRSCLAPKRHPTGRGGGQLLASKVWQFLASAEGSE